MILNGYIHDQLAAAHRRDLLDAAERGRLAAQARAHGRHVLRFPASRRAAPSRSGVESRLCAPCPPIATR
jgi:hypothetical protein